MGLSQKIYLITVLLAMSFRGQAQVEIDTHPVDSTSASDRYVDYSDQLLLKIMTVSKINELEIINTNNKQSIKLKPLGASSLGFGFNYKWLGLGITFGLPASIEDEKKFGKTDRFDFQLNIYSKKFVIDAFVQHYKGFYVANADNLVNWNDVVFPQRPTMETLSVGVGGYYVFNHKKLSYKAAYVRNALQKKSAGSFLLGGFYSLDYGGFPSKDTSSFVPEYFPTDIQDSLPIDGYTSRSIGISFGYTYTFVFFKRFFINLSLIPGVGSKNLSVYRDGVKTNETSPVGRFNGRIALGYENKHFLLGITSNGVTGNMEFENYEIKPTTNNVKVFVAKRFNLKKKK
jgi:hypothetical protein